MATITRRQNKNGSESFIVQIRLIGEKSVNRTFPSLALAETFARVETAKILERQRSSRLSNNPRGFYDEPLAETIRLRLEELPENDKQQMHLRTALRFVGNIKNGELNSRSVKDLISRMRSAKTYRRTPYKPATIARMFSVLGGVWTSRAEQFDLDLPSPFKKRLIGKHQDQARTRRLAPAEEQALRGVIESIFKPKVSMYWSSLLTMALETGARQQELVYATWSEFHLSESASFWAIPAEHTKSERGRIVPLSEAALEALKDLRTLGAQTLTDNDLVFSYYKSKASVSGVFHRIVKEANIKNFRFHDLRHEAITRLVLRDIDRTVLRTMVGHTKDTMTERYINLLPSEIVAIYARTAAPPSTAVQGSAEAKLPGMQAISAQVASSFSPSDSTPKSLGQGWKH